MTRIAESTVVSVPAGRIASAAERYLDSFPTNGHEGSHFTLRANVAGIAFECETFLKIVPASSDPSSAVLDVRLRPIAGPYPAFSGTLHATRLDDRSCRLDLDGSYAPPGALAGAAFDAVLGRRIAHDTMRDLLARFKEAFEQLASV